MSDKLEYSDLALPTYRNTRNVFANLNVSDLARAAVISRLNMLVVGGKGSGKTQLVAGDIYQNWFNGNLREGGNGVFIRAHPDTDIHNEIFTELNIEKAKRDLTKSVTAAAFVVDELNRAPPVAQNQFFGLGDGVMDYHGQSIALGKDGYSILLGTANIGNGEYQGTFATDQALFNRLHVALDLDHSAFMPTMEDRFYLDTLAANPNVRMAPRRDITDKIIAASREVDKIALDPGMEALAVLNYLRFGLKSCMREGFGVKDRRWPISCQDCPHNASGDALCSSVTAPVERTIQAVRKYAAGLYHLAKLKDPEQPVDAVDLMFKSFELTGAYQSILNPLPLQRNYHNSNPLFMAEVTQKLKDDFRANEDFIIGSLEEAKQGKTVLSFFDHEGQFGNYDSLSDTAKKKVTKLTPYVDTRHIGLGWMPQFIDFVKANYREKEK